MRFLGVRKREVFFSQVDYRHTIGAKNQHIPCCFGVFGCKTLKLAVLANVLYRRWANEGQVWMYIWNNVGLDMECLAGCPKFLWNV